MDVSGSATANVALPLELAGVDGRTARARAAEALRHVGLAGGDGTLNEVLNGIASAPGGLQQVRLGILPLVTINVFAREFGIPRSIIERKVTQATVIGPSGATVEMDVRGSVAREDDYIIMVTREILDLLFRPRPGGVHAQLVDDGLHAGHVARRAEHFGPRSGAAHE